MRVNLGQGMAKVSSLDPTQGRAETSNMPSTARDHPLRPGLVKVRQGEEARQDVARCEEDDHRRIIVLVEVIPALEDNVARRGLEGRLARQVVLDQSPDISDLVIEAKAAGISHTELIAMILDEALERYDMP